MDLLKEELEKWWWPLTPFSHVSVALPSPRNQTEPCLLRKQKDSIHSCASYPCECVTVVRLLRGSWGMVQDRAEWADSSVQMENSKKIPYPYSNTRFPWSWLAPSLPLVFCALSPPVQGSHLLCSAWLFFPAEFPWVGILVYTTVMPSSLVFTSSSRGFSCHTAFHPGPLSFLPVTEPLTYSHYFPLTPLISFLSNSFDLTFKKSCDETLFLSISDPTSTPR